MDLKRPGAGLRSICRCTVAVFFACAVGCFVSFLNDQHGLRALGRQITAHANTPAQSVEALVHWVYAHENFSRNSHYFVLPRLRATPMQVLESGGDCADKSRLLWAMLRAIDIPSTMALCFDSSGKRPTHTVVQAEWRPDSFMVVDPVFDLIFPKPSGEGYYGLLDLRNDSTLLTARLDSLRSDLPRSHKARFYNTETGSYRHASTINWDRSAILRWTHDVLRGRWGENIYRLRRPILLEEPKLFVSALCAALAFLVWVFAVMARKIMPSATSDKKGDPSALATGRCAKPSDIPPSLPGMSKVAGPFGEAPEADGLLS